MALVRWVRWAYSLEPPIRLHTAATGEDGAPRMSGDFLAWLRSSEEGLVACAEDEYGYRRTPLRCALFELHGRVEGTERAGLAHLALSIAQSDQVTLEDLGRRYGIAEWAVGIVVTEALRRLWDDCVPMVAR